MPLPLPEPDRTRLARSPLELVVCQLRFEARAQVADAKVALAIHQALGGGEGRYRRFEALGTQTLNVLVNPGAPAAVPGWRYQSAEGAWTIQVTADNVSLETSAYTDWEDFSQRMRELLEATAEHIGPEIEQRLGLRYIDRITEVAADSPADWRPYIAAELLGLAVHERLGDAVKTTRQQVTLDLGEGYSSTVSHGFVPEDTRLNYLLDFDLFREGGRPFSVEEVSDALEVLHDDAGKLFLAAITPELYEVLLRDPAEEAAP